MDYCERCGDYKYIKKNGLCKTCKTKRESSSDDVLNNHYSSNKILLGIAMVIGGILLFAFAFLLAATIGAVLGGGIVVVFNSLLGTSYSWKLGALVGAFLSVFTGRVSKSLD
jgi:hypothetical protein